MTPRQPLGLCAPLVAGLIAGSAVAGEQPTPPKAAGPVSFAVEAAVAGVYQSDAYWDIVNAIFPSLGFEADYSYAEGYVKPTARLDLPVGGATIYGAASAIGTFTLGEDIFGTRDVAAIRVEDAWIGIRIGTPAGFRFDLAVGRMPHAVGNGAMLNDGGVDGSATGALLLAPYKAWARAAVLKLGHGPATLQGFYLDAHEIATPDTETAIAGADLSIDFAGRGAAGVTLAEVVDSNLDYPQAFADGAGIVVIPEGRRGMRFLNVHARLTPWPKRAPGFSISGDLVHQWNRRFTMDAQLARFRVLNRFAALPLQPALSYGFTWASGDDPDTRRLERFDILFQGGDDFATGTSAGLLLANSNLSIHRFQLDTMLTRKDALTLKYFRISANQPNSPLAFNPDIGDGPPPDFVLAGDRDVANDIGLEYAHIFSKHLLATLTLYRSNPGRGFENLAGTELKPWVAGAVMIKANY